MTADLAPGGGMSADALSGEEFVNAMIAHLQHRIDQIAADLERHGGTDHGAVDDLHGYLVGLQVIRASVWPDRYSLPHGRRAL